MRGEQLKECDVEMLFQRPGLTAGARLTVEPVTVEGADENAGSLVLAMPLALRATEQESSGVEATDIRSLEEKLKPLITSDIEPVLGYRYFTPRSARPGLDRAPAHTAQLRDGAAGRDHPLADARRCDAEL